jgi:hypothetical protein
LILYVVVREGDRLVAATACQGAAKRVPRPGFGPMPRTERRLSDE